MSNKISVGMLSTAEIFLSGSEARSDAPVLAQGTDFDPTWLARSTHISFTGAVFSLPAAQMIVFVLTLDGTTMHWVADPADAKIWEAIDKWDRARYVDIVLTKGNAFHFRVATDGTLGIELNRLRPLAGLRSSTLFLLQALEVIRQPLLSGANTESASQPNVSACVLLSPQVLLAVQEMGIDVGPNPAWWHPASAA